MAVGGEDRQALVGLTTVLTLAGLSRAFDNGHDNCLDIRIIRGAISAAGQCIKSSNCVISADYASAFHTASSHAVEIINTCSAEAIVHATRYLQSVAGSESTAA